MDHIGLNGNRSGPHRTKVDRMDQIEQMDRIELK